MNVDLFGNLIVEEETHVVKRVKQSPFDFTNAIADKRYPSDLQDFNPFLANLSFSQRADTVLHANEMNYRHALPDRAQFDFYYYGLPKKKYFAKWAKDVKSDYTEMVMEYFNVSYKVAKQYEMILKSDQLAKIVDWHNARKGGK